MFYKAFTSDGQLYIVNQDSIEMALVCASSFRAICVIDEHGNKYKKISNKWYIIPKE